MIFVVPHLLDHELLGAPLGVAASALGHGHQDGVSVLPLCPPLLRSDGRDVRLGFGIKILLKILMTGANSIQNSIFTTSLNYLEQL